MPYVYRVESLKGIGVYRAEVDVVARVGHGFSAWNSNGHQPGPSNDPLLWNRWGVLGNYRQFSFGFASLKQARKWFTRKVWRKRLVELGMYLVKYWVPAKDYIRGQYQAVFKKQRAKQVAILWDF